MSSSDCEDLGAVEKKPAPKVKSLADIMLARQLEAAGAAASNDDAALNEGADSAADAEMTGGSSVSVPIDEGVDMMSYFSNPALHSVVPGLLSEEEEAEEEEAPVDSLTALAEEMGEEEEMRGISETVDSAEDCCADSSPVESPAAVPLRTVTHTVDAHHMSHAQTGPFHYPHDSSAAHAPEHKPSPAPTTATIAAAVDNDDVDEKEDEGLDANTVLLRTVRHSVDAHHIPPAIEHAIDRGHGCGHGHTHGESFHHPKPVGEESAVSKHAEACAPTASVPAPMVRLDSTGNEAEMQGPSSSSYAGDLNEIELASSATLVSDNCQLDSLFRDVAADATEPLVMKILTLQLRCDALARERDEALEATVAANDELVRLRELQEQATAAADTGSAMREMQDRVLRAEQARDMLFGKANQVDKFRNELRESREQLDVLAAENAELRESAANGSLTSAPAAAATKMDSKSRPSPERPASDAANEALVGQLRAKNEVLLSEMRDLQAAIDASATAAADRGADNTGAVARLNSQLLSATQENSNLMSQNRELQEQLYQLESSRTVDVVKISDQARELEAMMDQNRQLQAELYRQETGQTMDGVRYSELVREMDALRAQASEDARQQEYKLRDAEIKLDSMNEEVTRALQYKLQLDAEVMKVRKLGADCSALESQLVSAKSAVQKLEYDCGNLRNENSHLKQRIDILLSSNSASSGYGNAGAMPATSVADSGRGYGSQPSGERDWGRERERDREQLRDRAFRDDHGGGSYEDTIPDMPTRNGPGRGKSLASYTSAKDSGTTAAAAPLRRHDPTPTRQAPLSMPEPPAPPPQSARNVTRVPVNDQGGFLNISDRPMFQNNVERDDFLENMDKNYNERQRGSLGGQQQHAQPLHHRMVDRNPISPPHNDGYSAGGMPANKPANGGGGGARSLSDLLGNKAGALNTAARNAPAAPPAAAYERPTGYAPTKSTHASTNPFATDTYARSDEMASFEQLEKTLTAYMFEKTNLSVDVDKLNQRGCRTLAERTRLKQGEARIGDLNKEISQIRKTLLSKPS